MKVLLIFLSIIILPGTFKGMVKAFLLLLSNEAVLFPLLLGILISVFLYYFIIRRMYAFTIWEHEFTHALVALFFFRKIYKFVSSARGGYIQHSHGFGGEVGDVLISLAPYYLPTFTFISVLLRPLAPITLLLYYDVMIGFTLGYHALSNLDEIKQNFHTRSFFYVDSNQLTLSDIGRTGLITSAFIIVAVTFFIHGVIFNLLTNAMSGFINYLKLIYYASLSFIKEIVLLINNISTLI